MKKVIVSFMVICSLFISVLVCGCSGADANSGSSQDSVATATFEYTTKYYFEDENGKFALDDEKTTRLTAKKNTTVSADLKTFAGYVYDKGNLYNVLSGVVEDDTLVLKVYYKLDGENPGSSDEPSDEPIETVEVTVTFDTSNIAGLTFEAVTVYAGERIAPPEKNTYYQDLLIWKDSEGKIFDFSKPIMENITLIASEIQFIG